MKAQLTPVAVASSKLFNKDLARLYSTAGALYGQCDYGLLHGHLYVLPNTNPGDAETAYFADEILMPGLISTFFYFDNEGFVWVVYRNQGLTTYALHGVLDPHSRDHTVKVGDKVIYWKALTAEELNNV